VVGKKILTGIGVRTATYRPATKGLFQCEGMGGGTLVNKHKLGRRRAWEPGTSGRPRTEKNVKNPLLTWDKEYKKRGPCPNANLISAQKKKLQKEGKMCHFLM